MTNDVFFGESGLTSTSANHVANLAKEKISNLENEISDITFVTTSVKLISSDSVSILNNGWTKDLLQQIDSKLKKIAAFKSLIAWLREAIKAREEKVKNINHISDEEYSILTNTDMPSRPVKKHLLTVQEVIDGLSIKERNRYYELETIAAVYGKAIHPSGAFSDARKDLQKAYTKPTKVIGNGQDMTIYSFTPTISAQVVDDTFFELQKTYREAQAELNGIKHKIDTTVAEQNIEVEREYNIAMREYTERYVEFDAKKELWIKESLDNISKNFKIVMPNALKPLFDEITKK